MYALLSIINICSCQNLAKFKMLSICQKIFSTIKLHAHRSSICLTSILTCLILNKHLNTLVLIQCLIHALEMILFQGTCRCIYIREKIFSHIEFSCFCIRLVLICMFGYIISGKTLSMHSLWWLIITRFISCNNNC